MKKIYIAIILLVFGILIAMFLVPKTRIINLSSGFDYLFGNKLPAEINIPPEDMAWTITKTKAEQYLDVNAYILNQTQSQFCLDFPNVTKYFAELIKEGEIDARDTDAKLKEFPITKSKDSSGSFKVSDTIKDISKIKDKEGFCLNVTYPYAGEYEFQLGYGTVYIISNLSKSSSLTNVKCESGGMFCHASINDSSLVLYMPFDVNMTGSSTNEPDWSQYNNHGTRVGNAHWNATGKYGGNMKFDGTGDYIVAPSLNIPKNITVSVWVYDEDWYYNQMFVEKANVNAQWELFYEGTIIWRVSGGGDLSCATPSVKTWHLITAVQTDLTGVLYIDGVQCSSRTNSGIGNGAGLTYIGTYDAGGYPMLGRLDEVMIFNRSLSAGEVSQIYNQTFPRFKQAPLLNCSQETANSSVSCNGALTRSSGNYEFVTLLNPNYAYDASWSTRAQANSGAPYYFGYMHINYTKPISAVGATWMVKGGSITNLTIPDSCWNYDSNVLELNVSAWSQEPQYTRWSCFNTSNQWQLLLDNSGTYGYIYEEKMIWAIPDYAIMNLNVSISPTRNLVNITLQNLNQKNSTSDLTNLSLTVTLDGGLTWSLFQNMSNNISNGFTAKNYATSLNLSIYFLPDSNRFFSPILLQNISIEDYTGWVANDTINKSLASAGSSSVPEVFYKDGYWYLLEGQNDGTLDGFVWNGTGWFANATIATGVGDLGSSSAPEVYYNGTTWNLIIGESDGTFNGYFWNDTAWNLTTKLVSGLLVGTADTYSQLSVFNKDNNWYALTGGNSGGIFGFLWNGSAWKANKTINASIGDVGESATPEVFQLNNSWYLITGSGIQGTTWKGYFWNDTGWMVHTGIVSGLTDSGISLVASVFRKDNYWYEISGEGNTGGFFGHVLPYPDITSTPADTTPPIITIDSPSMDGSYSVPINFTLTLNEAGSECIASLNNFLTNYTMQKSASNRIFNYSNGSIADGDYTANFSCNDTSSNRNSTAWINFTALLVSNTCTYDGTGNWDVDCADQCLIANPVAMETGGNLTLTGTGQAADTFTIDADIININQIIETGCRRIQTIGRLIN